jgi:hypothetical protein
MNTAPLAIRAIAGLFVLIVILGTPPLLAQENEEEDPAGLYLEAGFWIAEPSGTEFYPATVTDADNPFDAELLAVPFGTDTKGRFRLGYDFGKSRGGIMVTYFSHEADEPSFASQTPGDYIYGEILAYPLFAGYRNDGLADGFDSSARIRLRDTRLDYFNRAFRTPRVNGDWFVGIRTIDVERLLSAEYQTLLNDLPPLIPPYCEVQTPEEEDQFPQCYPNLVPQPDEASMESKYSGRGIEAGMDFNVPFVRNRLKFEGGFVVAVLRGKIQTEYDSTTWLYTLDDEILYWPYDELGETLPPENPGDPGIPVAGLADQEAFSVGLSSQSISATSTVLEANLGLRGTIWRGLDLFGGLRAAYYGDVGADYRPKFLVLDVNSNLQTVEEVHRSVSYEGFYVGLSYQF